MPIQGQGDPSPDARERPRRRYPERPARPSPLTNAPGRCDPASAGPPARTASSLPRDGSSARSVSRPPRCRCAWRMSADRGSADRPPAQDLRRQTGPGSARFPKGGAVVGRCGRSPTKWPWYPSEPGEWPRSAVPASASRVPPCRLRGSPEGCALRCRRTNGCAVAKVCLVLSGVPRPRWKKAGQTFRLPSTERIEGTTACGRSDVRPSVKGPRVVRELGHAGVRLDCLNSSPRGCDRPPPGKTRKPGFLSPGDRPFAPVIFRQDTPCNEQGQGINGGPQRGTDLTDNHGIA